MGVKHLWDILSPVGESSSLDVLKNKTVAIDLSGWILESQKQKELGKLHYAYLRNLFFRIYYLLKLGTKPLFIIEGEAPDLKREVLFQRTQSQEQPSNSICLRRRFRQLLNECKEMIESLGLTCIQSSGEAEATCAYLNMNKMVDGCITDDSDAFLYGAQIVYRNFSIDPKDPHIEIFKMVDIENKLHLDRKKLVALALLLGCDYCQAGVPGIGKEKAIEFLENLKDEDVLERFEKWRNGNVFASIDKSLIKTRLTHCEICKHPGTEKKHLKDGCDSCGNTQQCVKSSPDFHCDCSWHQAQKFKLELSISEKALKIQDPEFPSKKIINEFLEFKESISFNEVQWNRPSLTDFQEINSRTLCWTVEKTREKMFPLITHWQITKIISLSKEHITIEQEVSHDFIMEPFRIIKECVRKFVESFIVEWNLTGYPSMNSTVTTIEVQSSFKQAYPTLTESYYATHRKTTEHTRKRKEKGLSSKISKKSSNQKKSSAASWNRIKVSKDKQGMALLQTIDVDSVNAKEECAPQSQKFSSSKTTNSDSLEMFNIPLSERIMMKNVPQLSMNKDTLNASNNSQDYILKNKLLQASSYINNDPPSCLCDDVDNKHSFLENKLSLLDNDKTNKTNNLSVKQKLYNLSDDDIELVDRLKNCKLFDNTSSDDSISEFSDGLIDKNYFKHSIICIDSESDDDNPKRMNETCDSVTIFTNCEEKEFESEMTAKEDSCKELFLPAHISSIPRKDDEYCEFSPLPLRERLKHK